MSDFLKKLKALMSSIPEKFKDAKLEDGTILKITEDLIEGAKIEIVNEDGSLTLPKAGELILEDGSKVTVDENGIITAIVAPDAEAEAVAEDAPEMAEEPKAVDAPVADKSNEEMNARISALEEAMALVVDYIKQTQGNMTALEKENSELKVKNEALSKVPAVEPIKLKKYEKTVSIKTESGKSKNEMLERIIALRENKK